MTENTKDQEISAEQEEQEVTEPSGEATAAEQPAGEAEEQAVPESVEDTLTAELEAVRAELAATKDQCLRIAAEADNFKKRIERERDTLVKYAGESILRELLNTLDNLDRALEQGNNGATDNPQEKLDALLQGVELTRKGLLSSLEKFEVTALASTGEPFDPNRQEALTMEASNEVPANHVLRELVKGYQFKDRLLRAAKVIVSSGPAK